MSGKDRIVSDEELADLTGYVQPSEQLRVLRAHGLLPFVRRDGKPRVTWDAVTQAMLPTAIASGPAPRFEHLQRTG